MVVGAVRRLLATTLKGAPPQVFPEAGLYEVGCRRPICLPSIVLGFELHWRRVSERP
jgi:hypothetical protein